MLTFQREKPYPFLKDAIQLFKQNYLELAERTDKIKFNPSIKAYLNLYEKGKVEIHTVRDEGKLVGYMIWFLGNYLHAKDCLTATSDILYISPEYRKGLTGYKFIQWTTEKIKKRNPQRIIFHVKPFLDYGPILEKFGANYFEKSYMIVVE